MIIRYGGFCPHGILHLIYYLLCYTACEVQKLTYANHFPEHYLTYIFLLQRGGKRCTGGIHCAYYVRRVCNAYDLTSSRARPGKAASRYQPPRLFLQHRRRYSPSSQVSRDNVIAYVHRAMRAWQRGRLKGLSARSKYDTVLLTSGEAWQSLA